VRYKVPKKWGDVVLDGDIPILDRWGTSVLTSAASRETVVREAGERGALEAQRRMAAVGGQQG